MSTGSGAPQSRSRRAPAGSADDHSIRYAVRWALVEPAGIVERDGLTYVASLPDGPIVVLDAVATSILEIALGESADEVIEAVAAAYGMPPGEVEAEVRDVLRRLEADRVIRLDHR